MSSENDDILSIISVLETYKDIFYREEPEDHIDEVETAIDRLSEYASKGIYNKSVLVLLAQYMGTYVDPLNQKAANLLLTYAKAQIYSDEIIEWLFKISGEYDRFLWEECSKILLAYEQQGFHNKSRFSWYAESTNLIFKEEIEEAPRHLSKILKIYTDKGLIDEKAIDNLLELFEFSYDNELSYNITYTLIHLAIHFNGTKKAKKILETIGRVVEEYNNIPQTALDLLAQYDENCHKLKSLNPLKEKLKQKLSEILTNTIET